ncbi:methionyl-tRNA formyltransferase [Treponema primitia ZAS-2]|uniref:Methionyl-tRNA formyltransferase n=1 Tax=Treponema primitia (strain ATCC BAA-887 / DSM 12427 / ZAS-2) TaxID=545694 RepID=F5YGU9_TREPZ|nr:methionyl-tRNA formyltransferase [Treponema primitia]AEF85150.1 methionyl-tRNA formyltransferase [Treponema primitia ZAS-2]
MRILFAGSPGIAVPALEALARLCLDDRHFTLAGVLTNPDAPRGRASKAVPTDVGDAAAALVEPFAACSLPAPVILKPEKLDATAREAVAALQPDILVSFAYGRIFGPKFLALFPLGGINIHPSLLPKYRGATPIPAAILGRDTETGLSIQRLAAEMDAGDILAQERLPLTGRETTASLSETAAVLGAKLLIPVLQGLALDSLTGRRQNREEASFCGLIRKEDGLIDWSASAADIDAKIRAYTPWPLCWTFHRGEQLYILEAGDLAQASPLANPSDSPEMSPPGGSSALPGAVLGIDRESGILVQTGDGVLAVSRLQYRAKKALAWRDFLNGARDFMHGQLGFGEDNKRD